MPLLTKSKYITGLKCPRYLWMMFHDLDKIPEHDAATLALFRQGNEVGQIAKKLFPEGVDIPEADFMKNIHLTKDAIDARKMSFEAGIMEGNIYARADMLVPIEGGEWDIVEVKGSNKIKPEHLHDISFQRHVYQKSGLKIRKCFLIYLNRDFKKNGEINPEEFFIMEEVTDGVDFASKGIEERIDEMFTIINNKEAPTHIHIGNKCNNGMKCECDECHSFLPESHVFELYYGGQKSLELLEAEVLTIKDIPDDFKLTPNQQIQRECAISGKPHIEKQGINNFLRKLTYPLYYFDFETFNSAVPIYEGTKPYQQIPFQFSLHVDDGKEVTHHEYLHDSKEDPRRVILDKLKATLGTEGSIIVYYKPFEIGRLKELAEAFPEEKEWVDGIISRIVDLMDPFKKFHYYDPSQKGSCSIKNILPAITGKSYKDLDIGDGSLASVSYYDSVFAEMSEEEIKKIRDDLLVYCKLDTEGMVWIVDGLKKLTN